MEKERRFFDLAEFEELALQWRNRARYFASINSTNQEARQFLRANPRHPQEMLLIADQQTAGRGRLGRVWQAPPASGLLCTLVFPLAPLPLEKAFLCTASLALSVVASVKELQPDAGIGLKWPNDLLRQGKKAGGILAEVENNLGPDGNQSWLILGFGLNISLTTADFVEAGLAEKATNLTPQPIHREILLAKIIYNFENYRIWLATEPDKVRLEWAAALLTLNQEVSVLDGAGQLQFGGLASGVAEDGTLIIQAKDGQIRRVQAGDVSIRMPNGTYSA